MTPSLGNSCGALNKKAQIMLHVSCWQFNCQSAETAPDFHQPNDWRKRWDLVSRQNISRQEAALVCDAPQNVQVWNRRRVKAAPHCSTMSADTLDMSFWVELPQCARMSWSIVYGRGWSQRCHSIASAIYHSRIIIVRLTSVSCSLWPRWPTVWPLMTYITPVTWESVTSPTDDVQFPLSSK